MVGPQASRRDGREQIEHASISRASATAAARAQHYITSKAPVFEAKAGDIIGLHWEQREHAVVFCVDEKTAIQAIDCLAPVLPMSPGRAE